MTLPAVSKAPILLLCSDSDVLAALQDMLEGAGYVVLPCKDLGSAMDWLRESKPSLLIVRPYLESISGHEAARYLRTKCNGLRVLMVTGLPDDVRIVYREALPSIAVFPKPFTTAEFLGKVAEVLAQDTSDQKT